MPIEIKELHIRIAVNNAEATPQASRPAAPLAAGEDGATSKEAIIAECVEQVMNLLKEKSER